MREKTYKVYKFEELSEKAKEKAIRYFWETMDFKFEWDCLKEDAENIGFELKAWDYRRYLEGDFLTSANECAESILKEHGQSCETYKTAKEYLIKAKPFYDLCSNEMTLEQEEEYTELKEEFRKALQEDYRVMADYQFEYCQSEEYIKELIDANGYEFTEDGKLD